jgi:hypothetical protein
MDANGSRTTEVAGCSKDGCATSRRDTFISMKETIHTVEGMKTKVRSQAIGRLKSTAWTWTIESMSAEAGKSAATAAGCDTRGTSKKGGHASNDRVTSTPRSPSKHGRQLCHERPLFRGLQ